MKTNNIECRALGSIKRSADNNSRHVEGYAIVFESDSNVIETGFVEVIHRGAITQDDVNQFDVICCLDHDTKRVYARSNKGMGSLTLTVDDYGLKYEFDAPNTSLGDELLEYLDRGDIFESSFCYYVSKDDVKITAKDGRPYHEVNKIRYIADVSPVWHAAYSATEVNHRNFNTNNNIDNMINDFKKAEIKAKLDDIRKNIH